MRTATVNVARRAGAESEDRVQVIEHPAGLVIALADGAGGMSGGSRAAELAVSAAAEHASRMGDLLDLAEWCGLLGRLDLELARDPGAGQCTCVVVAISRNVLCGASVGDSGAWLVARQTYCDLTRRQRAKPLLGSGAARPVPIPNMPCAGSLIVASDGLWKYASPDSICTVALAEEFASVPPGMVNLVRLPSGELPDDVAIALCRG